jgi:MATE family multidrug resistance protein
MVKDASGTRRHGRHIAALAWPLLVGQLAVIANGVIDTAMTSRFSSTDLAALAVGASIYVSSFVGLSGVLQAVSPVVGQLYGAKRYERIGYEIRQSLWLALLLCAIGMALLLFPQPLLALAHAEPPLSDKVLLYLRILALALPATLVFRIYTSMNTALARPKAIMLIQIGGLLLKIPLNFLFIFGGFGISGMGGPGCAIATAIVAWASLLGGLALVRRDPFYRSFKLFGSGFEPPQWTAQRALLKLGVPMGLSYLIEVTAYTFMALFIARMGAVAVAGHQVTANFGTVLYMLPLSIANATGTLVAQAIGAGRLEQARRIGRDGILLAALSSVTVGALVWLFRAAIIRAYTPDAAVMAAAMPLFLFIAFYQLFDSVQVTTAFVLRAYKVAVVPTLMYAVALWGVGLLGGYLMGLDPLHVAPAPLRGAAGFWLGNSASLGLVAAALLWYLRRVQKRALADAKAVA